MVRGRPCLFKGAVQEVSVAADLVWCCLVHDPPVQQHHTVVFEWINQEIAACEAASFRGAAWWIVLPP